MSSEFPIFAASLYNIILARRIGHVLNKDNHPSDSLIDGPITSKPRVAYGARSCEASDIHHTLLEMESNEIDSLYRRDRRDVVNAQPGQTVDANPTRTVIIQDDQTKIELPDETIVEQPGQTIVEGDGTPTTEIATSPSNDSSSSSSLPTSSTSSSTLSIPLTTGTDIPTPGTNPTSLDPTATSDELPSSLSNHSTSTSTVTMPQSNTRPSLSRGAIAGIFLGVGLTIAIVSIFAFAIYRRVRKSNSRLSGVASDSTRSRARRNGSGRTVSIEPYHIRELSRTSWDEDTATLRKVNLSDM
ncbi:uncharacterized protein FOMMEDRAFT_153585 [Fomitiporia mediterranea MF3/22]|uniref:uncharacterized protein n=1 Tax=Fomitiporia mediterranea (strain MF3/22) TaxID=694068 RepID=UPI0004407C24|nr:uncharacterized protein FOMMEDRAFT_153585 [Fomitiporia mediterranea MF3/22]EJD06186.1 hypothetical protein FOMMEDRAFT_153585 [Fomitiporia mediterranea MF3/22]